MIAYCWRLSFRFAISRKYHGARCLVYRTYLRIFFSFLEVVFQVSKPSPFSFQVSFNKSCLHRIHHSRPLTFCLRSSSTPAVGRVLRSTYIKVFIPGQSASMRYTVNSMFHPFFYKMQNLFTNFQFHCQFMKITRVVLATFFVPVCRYILVFQLAIFKFFSVHTSLHGQLEMSTVQSRSQEIWTVS